MIYTAGWYESAQFPLRKLDGFYAPYYFDGDHWFEIDQQGDGRTQVDPDSHGPFHMVGSTVLAEQARESSDT